MIFNFYNGVIGAEKSNFGSGAAWAGYAGLNLEKYKFILKTTFREEQSFSSLKYVAKTIKNVEIATKTLGYIGVGHPMARICNPCPKNKNHLSWLFSYKYLKITA